MNFYNIDKFSFLTFYKRATTTIRYVLIVMILSHFYIHRKINLCMKVVMLLDRTHWICLVFKQQMAANEYENISHYGL